MATRSCMCKCGPGGRYRCHLETGHLGDCEPRKCIRGSSHATALFDRGGFYTVERLSHGGMQTAILAVGKSLDWVSCEYERFRG